ncbi:MAG: DUF3471 domain-containing protein [Sediminibacterium sp.]|nr:DUF3471 domain-containing protein [Sediminibacterium sp.]
MQQQNLKPVALQERIQTIDIIRGFALFGIVVVNITVDSGLSPWDGWPGFADQLAYLPIKFFLDDKAMAMFTFLFGLSFAIQMQRAEVRNAPYVFVYMRRLFVLALIGAAHEILIGRDILFEYSVAGVLLLLLHKLNQKLLPVLAFLCILIPWTKNTFFFNKNPNSNLKEVRIDSTILQKYVGVYAVYSEPRLIITREGNQLFGEGQSGKRPWLAQTETEFFVRPGNTRQSFVKDSSGKVTGNIVHVNGLHIPGKKIQMDILEAKKLIVRLRNPSTYMQRVIGNARRFWISLKYWSWSNYFCGRGHFFPSMFPLFLLGLYAGRRKIFYQISTYCGRTQLLTMRFY